MLMVCDSGLLDGLYHGRRATSLPWLITSERARVVEMPRACIASDARNSRMDDLSTARPSPRASHSLTVHTFQINPSTFWYMHWVGFQRPNDDDKMAQVEMRSGGR